MKNSRYRTLFGMSLHFTLFFMILELAATTSHGALEAALAMLFVSFGTLLLVDCGIHPLKILERLTMPFRQCRLLLAVLAVYVLADGATLFYSPIFLVAVQKYKVELLMLFFFFALAYYVEDSRQIDRILANISAAGGVCALLSVLNLSQVHWFERHYFRRLSLRLDYNMFAAVLFTALVSGTFLMIKAEWKNRVLLPLLAVWWGLMGSVIYLSSSRRTWLAAPWCGLFVLALLLIFRGRVSLGKRAVQLAAMAVGVCLIGLTAVPLLEEYMETAYRQSLRPTGEGTAAQRYETLLDPGESKRLILWQTAWQEFQGYSGWERWIGRGAGYDILLYDQTDSPQIQQAYPDREKVRGKLSAHNFLLADLLGGGYIKLAVGLTVWAAIGWTLLKLLREYLCFGWLYGMELGYAFLNSSISNRYGFLYDKFFWVFLTLLCLEMHLLAQGRRRKLPR